jgi:hypothetical protein
MLKSRREWFRHVTALAVALCRPGAPAEASRTPVAGTTGRGVADADPLLTRSMFAGLLGDGFRVQNRPLALELTSPVGAPGRDVRYEAVFNRLEE